MKRWGSSMAKFSGIAKIVLVFSFIFVVFALPHISYGASEGKKSDQKAKPLKIVVKGPKAKFEKGYTVFLSAEGKRPVATQGSNYIEADTIKYFQDKNFVISEGNVVFKNFEKKIDITSGYSEFYGNTGDVIFSLAPRMYISNENMYVGGEKVFMNVNEDKVRIETNAFVTNENFRAYADRVEYISKSNLSKMFGNVKIFSTNLNVSSDIAFATVNSNFVSNYIAYGNVVSESKNIVAKSQSLVANFRNTNEIDNFTMITNVVVDGKDLYVEAFYLFAVISNSTSSTNQKLTFYTFNGTKDKRIFYKNKKEDTTLECDVLEVIMDENNEMVSSTAKGSVKVIR
jgi:lipopolysaccharide export system protein LptA